MANEPQNPQKPQDIWIDYTNYEGKRGWRHIIPLRIRFDENTWHSEQWLLEARDLDKKEYRTFALKDIHAWRETAPDA